MLVALRHVAATSTQGSLHRGVATTHSVKGTTFPIPTFAAAATATHAVQPYRCIIPRAGLCVPDTTVSSPRGRPSRGIGNTAAASKGGSEMSGKSGLTLYSWSTPNGYKASITLEELGLPYQLEGLDISTNVQKEDWFLKINPNGRIPALVDHDQDDLAVFETGAIMIYLAEKVGDGSLLPKDPKGRYETISWLMFQMGGVGPMQGQINFFARYSPEKSPVAIRRFYKETKRLYSVLESRLKDHPFLVQDKYTLADIANFGWVYSGPMAALDWNEYPGIKAWVRRIYDRPAVQKGLNAPASKMALAPKLAAAVHDDAVLNEILKEAKEKIEEE